MHDDSSVEYNSALGRLDFGVAGTSFFPKPRVSRSRILSFSLSLSLSLSKHARTLFHALAVSLRIPNISFAQAQAAFSRSARTSIRRSWS